MYNSRDLFHSTLNHLGLIAEFSDDSVVVRPSRRLAAPVILRISGDVVRLTMFIPIPPGFGDALSVHLVDRLNSVAPTGYWAHSADRPALAWQTFIPWNGSDPDARRTLRRRLAESLEFCIRAGRAVIAAFDTHHGSNALLDAVASRLTAFQPQREQLPARERVGAEEWTQVIARLGMTSPHQD